MKIKEPKLKMLTEREFSSWNEEELVSGIFRKNVEEEIVISAKTIDSCIFENIDFQSIKLENVDLLDVVFDGCDLSNQCFDGRSIERVIFRNWNFFY